MATYEDFEKLDIRVGVIIAVEKFPEARKPSYKLLIDFGSDIGQKRSSAQLTKYYKPADLMNKLVIGVVNFPPRQIGPFSSEALTLGVPDEEGQCILVAPENKNAVIGGRLF